LAHLGFFPGFMRAYGAASEEKRAQFLALTEEYRLGGVDSFAYEVQTSRVLGVMLPQGYR
jgi:hypothetical protein